MRPTLIPLLLAGTFLQASLADVSALRWRSWTDCRQGWSMSASPKAAWFGCGGAVWRYDFQTGKIRAWTALDGLPLETAEGVRVQVSGDDVCLLHFGCELYLHQPGKGWRRLGTRHFKRRRFVAAIGPRNDVYALDTTGTIWHLRGDAWQEHAKTVFGEALFALEGGFVIGHSTQRLGRGTSRSSTAYLDAATGKTTYYAHNEALHMQCPQRHFSAGPKAYLVFASRRAGEMAYFRVEGPKLVEDAAARKLDPHSPLPGLSGLARGGLVPPGLLPPVHVNNHRTLLHGDAWSYDPATGQWTFLHKDVAPAYRRMDPKTRETWVYRRVDRREVMRLVKVGDPKTEPAVLRTVANSPYVLGSVQFKDASGQWWGAGKIRARRPGERDRFIAFRIDEKNRRHLYDVERGIDGGYRPQIQLSPRGAVWVWSEKTSSRYDRRTDAFQRGEPWDDFAFKFGPWELSLAGPISSAGQKLCRKVNGKWEPLANPFGAGRLLGNPAMIRADRMLLSAPPLGVLEYDATNDRWIVLHANGSFRAGFTPQGYRVLAGKSCTLLLEGDPFVAPPDVSKESEALSQLLKLMDSDNWRQREDATQKLKKLYPNVRERLIHAAEDKSLSLEVRVRIWGVLRDVSAGPIQLPSLLRRMHPLVK